MMQFFHHPALDAIPNARRLRAVFAQLWGINDLWISTDRVSFNPPERPGHEFPDRICSGMSAWSCRYSFYVQGLVYLTDTSAEQGAFTCVPGFHNRIEAWLQSLLPNDNFRDQNLNKLGATPITGKAGDLII